MQILQVVVSRDETNDVARHENLFGPPLDVVVASDFCSDCSGGLYLGLGLGPGLDHARLAFAHPVVVSARSPYHDHDILFCLRVIQQELFDVWLNKKP